MSEQDERDEQDPQKDPDELDFDVDAWLEGAQPPRRSVTVYARGDLLAELEDLSSEAGADHVQRLAGSTKRKRLAALREQVEASKRVLHVRALEDEERAELIAKHTKPSDDGEGELDGSAYENEAYALALVKPAMSLEQVVRLRKAIGAAQWKDIGTAITRASVEGVSVPLSRLGSGDTPDS